MIRRPTVADAARVAAAFGAEGSIRPVAGGHINESFRVDDALLLQWINPVVFADPEAVQDNVECVLDHLRMRDPAAGWPELVATATGERRVRDATGLWRALSWIPDRIQVDRPETAAVAQCGAAAFARFVAALADLDPVRLAPTLRNFHDLGRRLADLDRAASQAPEERLAAAGELLAVVAANRQAWLARVPAGAVRVIHGDTKFANLLFTADRAGALAVDYDTVMPGQLAWDFGDLLRSVASHGAEDDPDGGRVRDGLLEAATRGYLNALGGVPEGAARTGLAMAPALMAFMLGVRFLTDFLGGDRYFRVTRRGQNLDRARHQLDLATALAARRGRLEALLAD